VGALATPALASSPSPWQPFRTEPFTDAPGVVCPFGLRGDIVKDHELVRTLQTNPDDSPREQEFVGPLIIRFTNMSTGASVERNLTGTGFFFFDPDGTIHGNGRGHIAIGIHPATNPPERAGEWVLTGRFDFVLGADGTRTFDLQGGTQENLCETLA
jgi:hypothetical protein